MVYNPYAKKYPRPFGWKSSSKSLSNLANKPLPSCANDGTQEYLAISHDNFQPHSDKKALDDEVKTTNQIGNSCNRLNKRKRNGNEPLPSGSFTTDKLENRLSIDTTSIATTEAGTDLPPIVSKKIQSNPYTKKKSNSFAQNIAFSSAKRSPSTPSRDKQSLREEASAYTIKNKVGISTKNSLQNTNQNSRTTRLLVGMNSNTFHEKYSRNKSNRSSRRSSQNENFQPEFGGSYLVGTAGRSDAFSSDSRASLPSRMALIRPDSWQLTNSCRDDNSLPFNDFSKNKSLSDRTQSLTCTRGKNICHPLKDTIENASDSLPRDLFYTRDEVKPIQDEYRMLLIKNAKLSEPLKNGWTLFSHQKKAIIRALSMRRMVLALDMGLGKTLIGTVWCKAFKETFGQNKLKVYVICPVSLKEEWKRTAEGSVGLHVDEEGWGKSKAKKKSTKKENSETDRRSEVSQKKIEEKCDTKMKMTICSWAKVPKVVESYIEHFVVCCDEAHAMQSTQSQRTKDILKLVNDKRCVGVLLLTGTPMKNGKPGNLFPLLKAVRHPLGRNQKAFETHFCNGMLKNFGRGLQWDASGASNLDQLKRRVASNLLHMTKEQCLTDLPPMATIFHDVPVSSRYQIQYEEAIKYLASVQANSNDMCEEAVLGAVQRLRVVCAHAKVEATVEMARTVLNKEPAVVIFTYFAQVAKNVHSKLESNGWPCCLLTGQTPQNKRQELVDKFQSGLSSVFVCTFGAGGVGLTLTAASTIILLDRPWTSGETRQAEDRIRRIGQVNKCTSYWMRSFELDKQIDGMLEFKKQTTDAVLDKNKNEKPISGSSAKISINRLVHKFVLSESRKNL